MSEPATITDFTIAPGVRETASEDGAVLLDIEQGICFSLNPVGLRIWELLRKGCSIDQIADALGQEFSVPRTQLLSDASEFIEALEAKHLICRTGRHTRAQEALVLEDIVCLTKEQSIGPLRPARWTRFVRALSAGNERRLERNAWPTIGAPRRHFPGAWPDSFLIFTPAACPFCGSPDADSRSRRKFDLVLG